MTVSAVKDPEAYAKVAIASMTEVDEAYSTASIACGALAHTAASQEKTSVQLVCISWCASAECVLGTCWVRDWVRD